MTARDDYPSHEQTFAAADAKLELARALLDRALPVTEGDPGWRLSHRDPEAAGRCRAHRAARARADRAFDRGPATDRLRPRKHAALMPVASVTGLQLTFVNIAGTPSATAPRRQSYALRQHGAGDALFGPLGPAGEIAYLVEGRLEKVHRARPRPGSALPMAAAAATIIGCAVPEGTAGGGSSPIAGLTVRTPAALTTGTISARAIFSTSPGVRCRSRPIHHHVRITVRTQTTSW